MTLQRQKSVNAGRRVQREAYTYGQEPAQHRQRPPVRARMQPGQHLLPAWHPGVLHALTFDVVSDGNVVQRHAAESNHVQPEPELHIAWCQPAVGLWQLSSMSTDSTFCTLWIVRSLLGQYELSRCKYQPARILELSRPYRPRSSCQSAPCSLCALLCFVLTNEYRACALSEQEDVRTPGDLSPGASCQLQCLYLSLPEI